MSNVASSARFFLPAATEWKPLPPQQRLSHDPALFNPPVGVSGAGDEARFLEEAQWGAYSGDWLTYLEGICGSDGDLARTLWDKLCSIAGNIPIPQAGPRPEGGFQFVWDRGEHHLEIDILADHSLEWFYRNRRTGEVIGDDSPAGEIPEAARGRFALIG